MLEFVGGWFRSGSKLGFSAWAFGSEEPYLTNAADWTNVGLALILKSGQA
ncbi:MULTISPECIES: hypothetical protein [unclassified Phaeobacter]